MAAWQTVRTGEANPHILKAYDSIAALRADESRAAKQAAEEARSGYRSSRATSLLLLVVGLLVALTAGSRSSRPTPAARSPRSNRSAG